jgi:hypothetical protein
MRLRRRNVNAWRALLCGFPSSLAGLDWLAPGGEGLSNFHDPTPAHLARVRPSQAPHGRAPRPPAQGLAVLPDGLLMRGVGLSAASLQITRPLETPNLPALPSPPAFSSRDTTRCSVKPRVRSRTTLHCLPRARNRQPFSPLRGLSLRGSRHPRHWRAGLKDQLRVRAGAP